jgi:hypothetical protein
MAAATGYDLLESAGNFSFSQIHLLALVFLMALAVVNLLLLVEIKTVLAINGLLLVVVLLILHKAFITLLVLAQQILEQHQRQ